MSVPIRGEYYTYYLPLTDSANRPQEKISPTIAEGDFKISKDGGAFANLATLPTVSPSGGSIVKIQFSQAEMDADKIVLSCKDVSGAEWDNVSLTIETIDSSPATFNQIEDQRISMVIGKTSQGGRTAGVYSGGKPDNYLVGLMVIVPSVTIYSGEVGTSYPSQFAFVVSNTSDSITVDRDFLDMPLLTEGGHFVNCFCVVQPSPKDNATEVGKLFTDGTPIGGVVSRDTALHVACAGSGAKTYGMETTSPKIRNLSDTGDLVSGTVDGNGNRTAVTITP